MHGDKIRICRRSLNTSRVIFWDTAWDEHLWAMLLVAITICDVGTVLSEMSRKKRHTGVIFFMIRSWMLYIVRLKVVTAM